MYNCYNKGESYMTERFYLYDDTVDTQTRFVSFMGEHQRYDLAILKSDRYYGKHIVLNILSNRFAIIGRDDLDEPGYIEHAYQLNEDEAEELRAFLYEIV